MFRYSKSLGLAGLLVIISGILHLAAPVLGGLSAQMMVLVAVGIIYIVIACWPVVPSR